MALRPVPENLGHSRPPRLWGAGRLNGPINNSMDALHLNSVGSLLADLSLRTEQLRGYL